MTTLWSGDFSLKVISNFFQLSPEIALLITVMTVDVMQNLCHCIHMHNNLIVKTPVHTGLASLSPLDNTLCKKRVMAVMFTNTS